MTDKVYTLNIVVAIEMILYNIAQPDLYPFEIQARYVTSHEKKWTYFAL